MRHFVPATLVLAAAAAGLHAQPEVQADLMLQGEWVVEKAERDKEPAVKLIGAKYRFGDKKMTMTPSDPCRPPRVAAYRVLAPAEVGGAMRIAFIPEDGDNKGDEFEGIFRFKDGALELCHCGVPRKSKGIVPTDFVTVRGSGIVLLTMKKQ